MSFASAYDSSRYVVPIKAPTSISINGVDLRSFGFELTLLPDLAMPPIRQRGVVLDGASGSIPMGDLYENWSFSLQGQLVGTSIDDITRKKDAFTQWIDIEQNNSTKFVIGGKEYYGLSFQINAAPLYYSKGTVTVGSSNLNRITGNGTKFNSYVKPGASFEVSGEDTIFFVESVVSDTSLILSSSLASAKTTASYRIERRKYLIVNYDGSSSISLVANRGGLSNVGVGQEHTVPMNLNVGFYTVYPYWIGDVFEHKTSNVNFYNGSFISLEGIGTAPVSPKYVIYNTSSNTVSNPEITTGDFSLHADFNLDQKARDINNDSNKSPVSPISSPVFVPTQNGYGLKLRGEDDIGSSGGNDGEEIKYATTTYCSNQIGQGSFWLRLDLSAYANSSDQLEALIFAWEGASSCCFLTIDENEIRLLMNETASYNNSPSAGSGNTIFLSYTTPNSGYGSFTSGEVDISGWWNESGVTDDKDGILYYGKLLLNGEIVATKSSSFTDWENGLNSIQLGDNQNNYNSIIYSEVSFFNKSLSDEELRAYTYSNQTTSNDNRYLKITSSVDQNDIFTYDSMTGSATKYDSSVGKEVNQMANVTGKAPVIIGDDLSESAGVYVKTSSDNNITDFRIIYRPHFR